MSDHHLPISIGDVNAQKRFIARHQAFLREFPEIKALADKIFVLSIKRYNEETKIELTETEQAEDNARRHAQIIVHYLGRTAFDVFGDLLVLAGNGRGFGARVMLRVMYEHLVMAAFIAKNPAEAKRFGQHVSVQKIKIWNRTLTIIPQAKNSVPTAVIEKLEAASKEVRASLKLENCNRCHQPITAEAWTRAGVPEMAEKVDAEDGSSLSMLYTTCFLVPTAFIHPTAFGLESRIGTNDDGIFFKELAEPEASYTTLCAHGVVLRLLKQQNSYFQLGLDDEVSARWAEFPAIWDGALVDPPSAANQEVPEGENAGNE